VLERRLNDAASGGARYEILNFGVATQSLLQQLAMLETRALDFRPDVVILTVPARRTLNAHLVTHLASVLEAGIETPYPELQRILTQAGLTDTGPGTRIASPTLRAIARRLAIDARMPGPEIERRLHGAAPKIVAWALERAARSARESGAVPVLLVLDLVTDRPKKLASVLAAAEKQGFLIWNLESLGRLRRPRPGSVERVGIGSPPEPPGPPGHRRTAPRGAPVARSGAAPGSRHGGNHPIDPGRAT
jgi:hypothetical protein